MQPHPHFSVVLNGEIQKPQIDFLRFLCYNKGVGIARCICKTNAKLAIKGDKKCFSQRKRKYRNT